MFPLTIERVSKSMIDRNLSNLKPRGLNLGREDEIRRAGDDMDIVPRRDQVTDDLKCHKLATIERKMEKYTGRSREREREKEPRRREWRGRSRVQ